MAIKYVRSTTGSDANGGTSWADAYATLKFAMENAAAGDTIYVSQAHAETFSTNPTAVVGLGTVASPQRILCVNDSTGVLTTGASITGAVAGADYTLSGSFYMEGITITAGTGTSDGFVGFVYSAATQIQVFKNCTFRLGGNNIGSRFTIGPITGGTVLPKECKFIDCSFKFINASHGFEIRAPLVIEGGSIESGSTAINNLIASYERGQAEVLISGMDLSNLGTTADIAAVGIAGSPPPRLIRVINCKMPASWSGSAINGTPYVGNRVEIYNCDSTDTNYRLIVEDYSGSIVSETTIVRSGGASDGTTPLSWKMVSSGGALYPCTLLRSPEIAAWNDTSGSSKTITVEVVTDNVTLNDDECWLEVMYLGTSGFPLGTWITDQKADVLASAASQTSSSTTWTTTGLTTPVKQKLSVTFTPQEKGPFIARVVLAKPSTTVYVDPMLTVS